MYHEGMYLDELDSLQYAEAVTTVNCICHAATRDGCPADTNLQYPRVTTII